MACGHVGVDVLGIPEQDEGVNQAGDWRGAADGARDLGLGIGEAEKQPANAASRPRNDLGTMPTGMAPSLVPEDPQLDGSGYTQWHTRGQAP
jgi:hypothetical protein